MSIPRLEYEWDEEKSRENVEKRQLDFSEVNNFDWDNAVIRPSDRLQEQRWRAIGYIGGRLRVVVFAERNERCRIISLRIANNKERIEYAQAETRG